MNATPIAPRLRVSATGAALVLLAFAGTIVFRQPDFLQPLVGGMSSGAAPLEGYPPPVGTEKAPTATPAADSDGRFPPPSIPHREIPLMSSPFASTLVAVRRALEQHDSGGIGGWVADATSGAALDRIGDREGYGVRIYRSEMIDLLDEAFDNGSSPVIQGYFPSAGCVPNGPEPCSVWIVTTGWIGPLSMPAKPADEELGPVPPPTIPLGAAIWEVSQDVQGLLLSGWWVFDGYHAALDELHAAGWEDYTRVH